MFNNYVNCTFLIGLLLLGCAHGKEKSRSKKNATADQYVELHQEFVKKVCAPTDRSEYETLNRKYKGSGHYLPEWNGDVDMVALKASLPHIEKKLNWINVQLDDLKKRERLPRFSEVAGPLKEMMAILLTDKKNFQLSLVESDRKKIAHASKEHLEEFNKRFKAMLTQIPFMLNFSFPVDHLRNRIEYDKHNQSKKEKDQHKSKELYLLRKLVEDGSMNPNRTQSDKFTRTMLDTLAIKIPEQKDFISENVRYDLNSFLRSLEFHLNQGVKWQIDRFEEWLVRTKEMQAFYQDLLNRHDTDPGSIKAMIESTHLAQKDLENFVIEREVKTYLFWKEQSELMRSLYVIETIFTNEVGQLDGPGGIERLDVGQVVLNRLDSRTMTRLVKSQRLYTELAKTLSDTEIQEEKWLNLMFKLGEFSFTYYFIPGVSHIFCADESKPSKNLRRQNVELALKLLENPRPEFKAKRYFSRESMIGRIDMSELWNDFKALPEAPGLALEDDKKWARRYLNNKYDFLYSFTAADGNQYQVLDFDGTILVVGIGDAGPQFYNYRNPHYFKYFQKK